DEDLLELAGLDDVGNERQGLTRSELLLQGLEVGRPFVVTLQAAGDGDRQAVGAEVLMEVAHQPRNPQAGDAPRLHQVNPLDAWQLPVAKHGPHDHACTAPFRRSRWRRAIVALTAR